MDKDKRGNEWPKVEKGLGQGMGKIAVVAYLTLLTSGVGALLFGEWKIFLIGFILFLMLAAVEAGQR